MGKDDSISHLKKKESTPARFQQKAWVKKLEKSSGRPIEFLMKWGVVYIVVDCSSSMADADKMKQAKKGAISFADTAQEKGYSVGLIQFASDAELLIEPQNNTNLLCAEVEKMAAYGSTNMAAAILLAIDKLVHRGEEKLICIVTDGMPDDEMATLDAAKKAIKEGIDIMTIGTDDADRSFLAKLATREGLSIKVPRDKLEEGIKSMAKMLPERK